MLAHTILALGAFAISSVSAQSYSLAIEASSSESASAFVSASASSSFSASVSINVNACEASPYRGLGCLASNTAAASECSSRVPAVTSTTTSTTSVLAEVTATPSPKTKVKSQETVSSTNIRETWTVTVSLPGGTTSYLPAVSTTCVTSTTTTYTTPSANATGYRQKRQAASSACIANGLESLSSFNNATLASACSCLNIAAPTQITTVWVTSFIAATTTSFIGLAPTTTAEFIDRATTTETVSPTIVTIPISSVKTTTETKTISLAAPTYAPNFGPKAGCSNMYAGRAEALPNTITEDCEADEACKELCSQEPSCKFLYVQRLFADYGDATPYYQCYMNDQALDEKRDLQCGRQEGIYGMARGFDACGRGVAAAPSAY